MNDIKSLGDNFEEIQEYSKAQFQVISDQNKKIKQLQEENAHLKVLLEKSVGSNSNLPEAFLIHSTDEETACKTQLKLLKDVSLNRELTLEEARKLEIYTKLLLQIKNSPKTLLVETKKMKSEDLLALIDENETKDK